MTEPTTTVRHVQIAAQGDDKTAVRTFSGRWFTLTAPCETAVNLVSVLSGADHRELPPTAQQLRAMLIEGGSAVARGATPGGQLGLAGCGPLFTALRTAGSTWSEVPAVGLDESALPELPPGLVILIPETLDDERTRAVAAAVLASGRSLAPFFERDGRGWFGPLLVPGGPLDLTDLINRLDANADRWPGTAGADVRRLGGGITTPEIVWMAAAVEVDTARWFAGEPALCDGYLVEFDPAGLRTARHPVLPWPDRGAGRPRVPDGRYQPEDLIDDRTGVINRLSTFRHHVDIPRQLVSVHSHVSRLGKHSPWHTDATAAGTSFVGEQAARGGAIGEAVERYSGNIVQAELLRTGTWRELSTAGEYALDPESMVLFSERQYATPGFPFAPFTRDLDIHWVRGKSLTRNRSAWLPACMSYGNWRIGPYRDTVKLSNLYWAGLAAGPNLEFAIVSALQEIVERHATMIWWANAQALPSIREYPAALAALWGSEATRAWLVPLPNEFDIPVMAGFVEHTGDRLLTVGCAARSDPAQAALKAWAEALTLQDGARNLDRPRGGYRQSIERGEASGQFLKPWRADRRYLDDYRPDFRDAPDLMCQLQVYLDPRAAENVRPWIDTPTGLRVEDVPAMPDPSLAGYAAAIESRGYEIFYADLTTPDVACTGMRVVRVFVPGLIGNFAAAFPYLGRGRLQQAAVDLGWRSAPLREDEINVFPMPHA